MIIPTRFIALFSLFSLTACSTYEESFDCPIGDGIPCASLSKVSRKMDQGEIKIEDLDDLENETIKDNAVSYGVDFLCGLRG